MYSVFSNEERIHIFSKTEGFSSCEPVAIHTSILLAL